MSEQEKKLTVKDLIISGAFAALYSVLVVMVASVLGFIPITYIIVPFVLSIILGPVYMMYTMKVPKFGAIIILGAIVGLVTSMGGVWYAFIWSLLLGILAEYIAKMGDYKSMKMYILSFCVFACSNMGPFFMIIFAKAAFLEKSIAYYGEGYANRIDELTPSWIVYVFIVMALVGGLIGGKFGERLLSKHFTKAGIIE